MAFSVLPHWTGGSIFDIDPDALAGRGITLLLADLDNTLVPYGVPEPTEAVRAWNRALEEAGVTLFVLSNNRHPQRPERFAHALGVPFLGHAGKPRPAGFRRTRSLPTSWGGGTPGCSPCWWSPSAWRAIRAATCATLRSGPSASWENGGQNPYERNLRPGGQRRLLPL